MNPNQYTQKEIPETTDFSIADFLRTCLKSWPLFAMSFIVVIGLAFLYIATKEPVYERTEEVLIKDQDSGGGIADISSAFSSLGLVANNTNVNNELISLTSPAVVKEVVERLRLDMNFSKPGFLHRITLYGDNMPLIVSFDDISEFEGASATIEIRPDSSMVLSRFSRFSVSGKEKFKGSTGIKPGQTSADSPIGKITVSPNPGFKGRWPDKGLEIKADKMPLQFAVEAYKKKLFGDLVDLEAEVIGLTVKDVSVQRAVDFLEELLVVYNQNWIEDKNKIAVATSAFIDERLKRIYVELGDVDSSIASYQTSTGTPDLAASAELSLKKELEISSSILDLETKAAVASQVREYIADSNNRNKVIPLNVGIGSEAVEQQIAEYNRRLLTLNNLKEPGSSGHPVVAEMESTLDGLREAVVRGLDSHMRSLSEALGKERLEFAREHGKVASAPTKALPLLSEERQRTIKESLYLFLLQKREENELSQAFTAYNTRIITPPMGSLKPVSPKKILILAAAFIMALVIPVLIIYIRKSADNFVHSKKDLAGIAPPFAGEIPLVDSSKKMSLFRKKKTRLHEEAPATVVAEGKRDVVNEAFRVVRGNLEFMEGNTKEGKVYAITSFNPGSGKSFISYNLALSFAIKGKRVLVIDCDMRHASSSMYVGSPSKGLSTWLAATDGRGNNGETSGWRSLLVTPDSARSVSILPAGKLPPNPAELIENPAFAKLIEDAKGHFDYVFLDCPPINIVADTHIASRNAGATIFVLRAGVLQKDAIAELNEFYNGKRLPKICVILNGTDSEHSRYYTYGNYQHL